MAKLDEETLPEGDKDTEQDNEVVELALELLTEAVDVKSDKEATVDKAKDYIEKLLNGEDPQKIDQFISYLPLILVNVFTIIFKVPDLKITRTGYNDALETLMSAYLEKVLRDAGFVDMMETGFGGAYQAATYGDYYILGQTGALTDGGKLKKGEKLVQFQGLSVGNAFFNRDATVIRANYVSQDLTRFGVITDMNKFIAEQAFPGIMEKAEVGRIPNSETEDNATGRKTSEQESYEDKMIEILFFYDKAHGIFSIIAGSNAYEYKRVEDKDFTKAFEMMFDGIEQIVLPIAGYGLEPRPEGIYHSGLVETFWRLFDLDTKISTSLANNVLESNYSPELWNIENVDSADLLNQIGRGKREKQLGNRPVIIPKSASKGQPVGQANVAYLKPNELSGENTSLEQKIVQVFRRMGYDVDFNFTDPSKTLGQSEIDLTRTTSKVGSIQSNNLDFYKFADWYAIDKIVKLGNRKSEKLWGGEVEVDVGGELITIEKLAGKPITEGFIIGLFQDSIERLAVDRDIKSGVMYNDALERRAAEREIANTSPGSPQQLRALRRLSIINGGGKIKMSDIIGIDGQAPEPKAPSQPVADQL